MKKCPFCQDNMQLVDTIVALKALGLDMEGNFGSLLKRALTNPKGAVYCCTSCKFIAIFA